MPFARCPQAFAGTRCHLRGFLSLPFAWAPFAAFCAEEPRCHLRRLLSLPFARRSLAAIRAGCHVACASLHRRQCAD